MSDPRGRYLPSVALIVTLYLMYAPVFLTDYLMNDEWYRIGSTQGLIESAKGNFFLTGRSLYGITSAVVDRVVGFSPYRLQVVRFLNCTSIVAIAFILFLFLEKRSANAKFSFLVVLFLFSQRSFQSLEAYSMLSICNAQPAMWLSLLAFYAYFNWGISKAVRLIAAGALLILAMQATQAQALFCVVPLSYLALSDWKNQSRKVLEFLFLAVAVTLLTAIAYKAGLHSLHALGEHGYNLGEESVDAIGKHPVKVLLQVLNPFTYWDAFQLWSYPFPLHNVRLWGSKEVLSILLMSAWGSLIFWAFWTDLRRSFLTSRVIVLKWFSALACLAVGAIFVFADAPLQIKEHRPHMTLTFVGVVIFLAAYGLRTLAEKHRWLGHPLLRTATTTVVVAVAFGAQAGVLRAYVDNRMRELDFIRTELVSGSPRNVRNLIVVPTQWGDCLSEPCGPYMGHSTEDPWHQRLSGGYLYALASVGISPDGKSVSFVQDEPKKIPANSVVIDWKKYASAAKAELQYQQRSGRY